MKLSKRGEYGLRAMIDLSGWDHQSPAGQIRVMAERQQIPAKFLE